MVYADNPLMALMPKYTKFGGKNLPIPITYGLPQGRSAAFATAKANKTNSKITDFTLTRAKDYSLADIDNETMEASMNDADAFLRASTFEIDNSLMSLGRSFAISQYRTGSGSVGQIAATVNVATAVLPLTNPEDVTNFELGQVIVSSTANGGGAIKNNGGVENALTIIAINRDTGVLTMSANLNSFAAQDWAAADYLFVQGDYDAKVKGLSAWVPATAPTNAAFFGVDRSVDTRLGGLRKDVSNMPIEEGLISGLRRAEREGARISHYFMKYDKWSELEMSLGSKVQYVDLKTTDASIGFRGIVIQSNKGPVSVLADQNCIADTAFGLQMDTWKVYSLNELIRMLNLDGLKALRNDQSDSIEIRCGYYAQIGCNAPGWNINLKLA
jgi:hypothetical protein